MLQYKIASSVGTQSQAVAIRVLMDEQLATRQKLTPVFKEIILGALSFALVGLCIRLAKH